ncbi:DUF4142 domain-containing protein [Sphingobacterium oryzagri]|uniref:DUF4142 domain-containing protein n=1 Tax=Sphingobacterium oryzagri TaxID=3025669 RepID=A0ABY7WL65_9SPHI|nr:DUF4142 domain-containing protein [Sphingobacterium sp. KACC 22765]WDF70342.1 DUF4142 domain-containing protein [Sphingobacterium sp. KACC 22765]
MKKYFILCFSMLGVLAISFSQAQAQQDTATMDQDFLSKAVNDNRFKVAIGSQALERSNNDAVKQFAQGLVTDHTRALEELEQAATAKKLVLPDAINENHASILKAVGGLSGDNFNTAFKDVMVKSHEDAIALYELAAGENGLTDPELRTWAGEKVQTLKSHLEKAKALPVTTAATKDKSGK